MGLLRRWYPSQVRVDVHEGEGTGGGAFRGALLVLTKKGGVMGLLRRCCSFQVRGMCTSGREVMERGAARRGEGVRREHGGAG